MQETHSKWQTLQIPCSKFQTHNIALKPQNQQDKRQNTHAEVQLPSVPLSLWLASEEQIIIIIIIVIIQRPTPVFQAKLKQSETARGSQTGSEHVDWATRGRVLAC